VAWPGVAGHGTAGHGMAWLGKARLGTARQGKTRQLKAGQAMRDSKLPQVQSDYIIDRMVHDGVIGSSDERVVIVLRRGQPVWLESSGLGDARTVRAVVESAIFDAAKLKRCRSCGLYVGQSPQCECGKQQESKTKGER